MQLYGAIQKAVLATIHEPNFGAALPSLSDATWIRLLSPTSKTKAENERLEFLGDALMYATIGRQLYAHIPDGTPGLYTNVRAALHSNLTFSHLAEKSDILAVSSAVLRALTRRTFGEGSSAPAKSKCEVKATADLFETVIGAYYLDHGFEALCSWVSELYSPLITCAVRAFRDFRDTKPTKGKRASPVDATPDRPQKKRRQSQIKALESMKLMQIRTAKIVRAKHKTSVSSSSIKVTPGPMSSLLSPSSRKRTGLRISRPKPELADRLRPAARPSEAVVIDLTADSDTDDAPPVAGSSNEAAGLPDVSRLASSSRHRLRSGTGPLVSQRGPRRPETVTEMDDGETSSSEDEYVLERMLTIEDSITAQPSSDMDICMSSDWDGQASLG